MENKVPELTQERLKELLYYSPQFGIFVWKPRPREDFSSEHIFRAFNINFSGKIAGTVHSSGYVYIWFAGKKCLAHRLVWLYMYGVFPEEFIDHINCIKSDNRLLNLRPATRSQNAQNISGKRKGSTSKLLGVFCNKTSGLYVSRIQTNFSRKHLGTFKTEQEAHDAYVKAKRELHLFNTI